MDMHQNPFMALPGITPEEMNFIQQGIADLNDNQKKYFYMDYSSKRKSPQDMLIFCLVGLCLIPGLQRFITGQIGMGVLYLFTAGLCLVGSVVDLVNYRTLAEEYNRKVAFESFQFARMAQ
ncbi:NINE protein [Mucilaginibacter sp. X4EP1]|jgi:TM2 domain-containing membrane protein YozV|uniref:NINE protein n=1 Tax=Mucilaginibacter sp. X4EP1 TaxID=2723092 RepID=UPI0021692BB9|nr:NINE protein [Mucilaginibacter sp. X4EP1]MCS3816651.1 TM2 domain-containing membrane protein YozV [Mucilaginibacter sp. X4EP1]